MSLASFWEKRALLRYILRKRAVLRSFKDIKPGDILKAVGIWK